MTEYSVDKIENSFVVLVDVNEKSQVVPIAFFAKKIKEGDIVWYDGEKYQINNKKTNDEKAEIEKLLKEIGAI